MEHWRKILTLSVLAVLLVAGTMAAVLPFLAPTPPTVAIVAVDRCFTAGSVTYRVSTGASTPDYRVKIDSGAADPHSAPDLRIQLVDSVESADFALVDGFSGDAGTCASAGHIKTVQVVGETSPADVTLRLSGDPTEADLKLFVHSERLGERDAAALFAAMRHDQMRQKLAQSR
jgi:hypothetical protein